MRIEVYIINNCNYCSLVKEFLISKDLSYTAINIEKDSIAKEFLKKEGHKTVPQIYIDGKCITGGYEEMIRMDWSSIV